MILKVPSGFYKTVLPPNVGDTGNVTYTISSGSPPRIELNFSKINKTIVGNMFSDDIVNSPDISILTHNQNNVSSGVEPRPIGSIVEFNDRFKSLGTDNSSGTNEFTSARYSNDQTIDNQLFKAYDEFQIKLLEVSEKLESLLISINNDEIYLNMNIAKIQAIDEALKILSNNIDLVNDRERVSSDIEKLENNIFENKSLVIELNNLKSQYIDSIQRLSRVI